MVSLGIGVMTGQIWLLMVILLCTFEITKDWQKKIAVGRTMAYKPAYGLSFAYVFSKFSP